MKDPKELFNPQLMEVNSNPLQRGGLRPELIREVYVPARQHSFDTRWIMDAKLLEHLLDLAKASSTNRVVVHHATIRVRKWRDPSGHMFETYSIVGSGAEPEPFALDPRGSSTSTA